MKKIYVEPTLKMVKIGGQMLLVGSDDPSGGGFGDDDDTPASKSFIGTVYDDEEDTGSDW